MRADPSRLLSIKIVFEDDELLVVNKPSGMAVHPGGEGEAPRRSLIELLAQAYGSDRPELHLAHRLDRGTSGLVIVAKSKQALAKLTRRWGEVDKRYLAVVVGSYAGPPRIDRPLPDDDGIAREATTHLSVLSVLSQVEPTTTLVEARIETGRTHQIRKHLQAVGFPVLLDDRYGDFGANKAWSRAIKAQNGRPPQKGSLFLHAWRLAIPDGPRFGAPPPDTWTHSLELAGLERDLLVDPS